MIPEGVFSEAKTVARSIFDFEVQTLLNTQTDADCPGEYDFKSHVVHIYERHIESIATEIRNDKLSEVVNHVVSHEYGHAKNALRFSTEEYFPYISMVSRTARIRIDDRELRNTQLKSELSMFIDKVLDFTIDKKLHHCGLIDHTPKCMHALNSENEKPRKVIWQSFNVEGKFSYILIMCKLVKLFYPTEINTLLRENLAQILYDFPDQKNWRYFEKGCI